MKRTRAPRTGERKYRGYSMEQLRAERRERLLEVAYSMIASHGYASLSIERVCAGSRVATRHFYEHFNGREALLHALFDRLSAEMLDTVVRALTIPEVDIVEQVMNAVRAVVRFALSDPRRAKIVCLESVGVSPDMELRRRTFVRRFAALIDQASQEIVKQGGLLPASYVLSGVALVGATNELMVEWLTGETGLTVEEMEHKVVGFYRSLVKGAKQFAIERLAEGKNRPTAKSKRAAAPKPKARKDKR